MMRMLGVLVGSGLALAALVVFVGIPKVQTDSRVTPIGDNGVIRLPVAPVQEPAAPIESGPPAPAAASTVADAVEEIVEELAEEEVWATGDESVVELVGTAAELQHWYAFWAPFRTEIAANGFVTQLQRVTGLDYRVVKVKTGVYEVAFAYSDDDEILSNLSQISAATGLQLPEG